MQFKQYLEMLENDTKRILIGFLRFYGINMNSNIPQKGLDFKIEIIKNKEIIFSLLTTFKKELKKNEKDCLITNINITKDYIEIYYSKFGDKKTFRVDFNTSKILKYSAIDFIEIVNEDSFRIAIPKENKRIKVKKIIFRRI